MIPCALGLTLRMLSEFTPRSGAWEWVKRSLSMLQMDLGTALAAGHSNYWAKPWPAHFARCWRCLNDARHHYLVTDSYLASLETLGKPRKNKDQSYSLPGTKHVFGWRWAGTHPDRHIRRETLPGAGVFILARRVLLMLGNMTIVDNHCNYRSRHAGTVKQHFKYMFRIHAKDRTSFCAPSHGFECAGGL